MTSTERRASFSLAGIYALRMLGLFLVLPVFSLEATRYPDGNNPALIGLAMGVYGLTQALLQIPFGMASDIFGRKRTILLGLLIFAIGSFIAANADSITTLIIGRAIQGAGAISAAITALLADLTRDVVRTKAMALVGISIGLTFALSLVLAPILVSHLGLPGLFMLTTWLALLAMSAVQWWTPPEPTALQAQAGAPAQVPFPAPNPVPLPLSAIFKNRELMRLNLGVFVLHTIQLAMWVAVPALLVAAGLPKAHHWQIYLPAVIGSFALMGGVFSLERKGYMRSVFLSAIGLIALVQFALWLHPANASTTYFGIVLFIFFCGFNVLEATQPSLVSKLAKAQIRGTALGVYNTLQSLGLFAGGFLGGALSQWGGSNALFASTALLALAWLALAWNMRSTPPAAPDTPDTSSPTSLGAP